MENTIYLYTDGACKGNPGIGGWGFLLICADQRQEDYGGEEQTTNNRMELQAVIEGLSKLDSSESRNIVVYTDSQYVKKGMSEWINSWKNRGWKTASNKEVKNKDLWQRLDQLNQQYQISWRWVKAHAGHPENERADALANQGINQLINN